MTVCSQERPFGSHLLLFIFLFIQPIYTYKDIKTEGKLHLPSVFLYSLDTLRISETIHSLQFIHLYIRIIISSVDSLATLLTSSGSYHFKN